MDTATRTEHERRRATIYKRMSNMMARSIRSRFRKAARRGRRVAFAHRSQAHQGWLDHQTARRFSRRCPATRILTAFLTTADRRKARRPRAANTLYLAITARPTAFPWSATGTRTRHARHGLRMLLFKDVLVRETQPEPRGVYSRRRAVAAHVLTLSPNLLWASRRPHMTSPCVTARRGAGQLRRSSGAHCTRHASAGRPMQIKPSRSRRTGFRPSPRPEANPSKEQVACAHTGRENIP